MERQFASPENYHNTYNYSSNHTAETTHQTQEPQSEVVIASNLKPSSINNSQWYKPSVQQSTQSSQSNNVIYNNVKTATPTPQPSWQQPTFDNSPYSAPVHQSEPSYAAPEPSYAPPGSSYAPKPSSWGSSNLSNLDRLPSLNTQTNDYSFMNNKSTLSQESTQTQQYHSGYVPPPWEADTVSYKQPSYYEPQTAPVLSSNVAPTWQSPTLEAPKKRPPLSYQPPAPNASFVKQASPAPSSKPLPGRKTYYSEYERRYISVPESTYIPTETKVQPQWDASPQYYYDNSEPTEEVEPPWRKELREFTEKSTRENTTTTVQPPWQENSNYSNNTSQNTSTQQTWSQTLRPKSWVERSYESDTVTTTQEWPRPQNKRPTSDYVQGFNSPSVERTRGMSVDRYNSNYQSPGFAPSSSNGYSFPWENQEQASLSPQPHKAAPSASAYHNPQVPAYHSRPTESRDYQVSYQPRWSGQGREKPVQSRSFKYLQMLTGTEDGEEEPEPFVVQHPHHAVTKPRRI